ncbi:MAG: tRNA (adenosine(37)-N6)-dimethylallyltransferase MiaA [Epsilonproteobacteria bacterium]|nr:MAG: tRNA (adenosine(37)-N6)-dimethylallyltransferase MiaA [Campylobacterota bacterium]
MKDIKQLAIIGSTASGKTALSIGLAQQMNAYILSLDSLAIYKDIDIVSAKPTLLERDGVGHFGLDYLYPNEDFSVSTFIKLYHESYAKCMLEGKNLIIVGGTSFYLKMLLEGVSVLPEISQENKIKAQNYLLDRKKTYDWLSNLDASYMSNIKSNDVYRIEKVLDIYLQTGQTPSEYFTHFPPQPSIKEPLDIYQITGDKNILRERITKRTNKMLKEGLIDEVCMLEKKYTRSPLCMKAIGIKETLAYLDGQYNKEILLNKIVLNTARLAKRQTTFNQSQFNQTIQGSKEELEILFTKFGQ